MVSSGLTLFYEWRRKRFKGGNTDGAQNQGGSCAPDTNRMRGAAADLFSFHGRGRGRTRAAYTPM